MAKTNRNRLAHDRGAHAGFADFGHIIYLAAFPATEGRVCNRRCNLSGIGVLRSADFGLAA